MRNLAIFLLSWTVCLGCDAVRNKVDNPVMGPPPPRTISAAEHSGSSGTPDEPLIPMIDESRDNILMASNTTAASDAQLEEISDSQIVATVNGAPIFASEVLQPYRVQLEEARHKMPPVEYHRLRRQLVARDLGRRIERTLLIETLRETLAPTQVEQLQAQLEKMFEQETERLKRQYQANTTVELEQKLRQRGDSLERIRDEVINNQMAREYLSAKAEVKQDISRRDMLEHYREHQDDYAIPARVKWQQIAISYAKHGGKDEALVVLEKAIAELKQGADFADVAQRYSDGPTAEDGGQWDWTQTGSLADQEIEKALFELPVGSISRVFTGDDSYQLVFVNERDEAGHTPFETLQDDIKRALQEESQKDATQKVMQELIETAVIETIFDRKADGPSNAAFGTMP